MASTAEERTTVELSRLISASMPGAERVRVMTMTDDDIVQRAREGCIFAHPNMPRALRRWVRQGRFDYLLRGTRQALRDIEKPVDLLKHEARAAWILSRCLRNIDSLNDRDRGAVANAVATAIRLGTRD